MPADTGRRHRGRRACRISVWTDRHNLARGRRLVIVVARPNRAVSEREWTVPEACPASDHEAPGVRLSYLR
jgi:hypothetical protein